MKERVKTYGLGVKQVYSELIINVIGYWLQPKSIDTLDLIELNHLCLEFFNDIGTYPGHVNRSA
jgi:hypothetical protein